MNYSNIRITLDMQEACSGVSIQVKKKDIGRKIYITLMDDGIPYSITEGCTAAFTAEKPDGKIVYDECEISGNTIIYEVAAQVVAVSGRHECEMKLYGADGKLLTSSCFDIIVDDTVYEDGDEVEAPSRPTRVLLSPSVGCKVGQVLVVEGVDENGNAVRLGVINKPAVYERIKVWQNNTFLNAANCPANTPVSIPADNYIGFEVCFAGAKSPLVFCSTGFIPTDISTNFCAIGRYTTKLASRPFSYDPKNSVFEFKGGYIHGTDRASDAVMLPVIIYGFK